MMTGLERLLNPPRSRLKRDPADQTTAKPGQLERLRLGIPTVGKDRKPARLALRHLKNCLRFLGALRAEIIQRRRVVSNQTKNLPGRDNFLRRFGRASVGQWLSVAHGLAEVTGFGR